MQPIDLKRGDSGEDEKKEEEEDEIVLPPLVRYELNQQANRLPLSSGGPR